MMTRIGRKTEAKKENQPPNNVSQKKQTRNTEFITQTPFVNHHAILASMLGLDYSSSDDSDNEDSTGMNRDQIGNQSNIHEVKSITTKTPPWNNGDPLEGSPVEMDISENKFHHKEETSVTTVFYSTELVNPATVERCKQYLSLHNFDLTESIRSKKDFGNPHILDVVVEHFKIDEVSIGLLFEFQFTQP